MNSLGFDKAPEQTRIVVAMSGGVDSSVVAGLLKQEGYEVIGITLQLYDSSAMVARAGSCCAGQDIADARRVCETLHIPYYVLDYERRFEQAVIAPFIDSYARGETPVPCVLCNMTVKFTDLMQTALDLGADALATGHYIRNILLQGEEGQRGLYCPYDTQRDQSYFLFSTTQEQINYLRFPLGELPKKQVRQFAAEMGLQVAQKQDSQDICFVPQGRYADFIKKTQPELSRAGQIIHIDGRILGTHEGIIHYTIGQRRGLKISIGEPLYVVAVDAEKAELIVGPRSALGTHKAILRGVNWLGTPALEDIPPSGVTLLAKVRSTQKEQPVVLSYKDNQVCVEFLQEEFAVACGQACVFYQREEGRGLRLLGGGIIAETFFV